MIELGPCEITGVFGPPASGKTHLIQNWLQSDFSLMNRCVIFDVTGEYVDDENYNHVWSNPRELARRIMDNQWYFRVAYHCGKYVGEEFEQIVRVLCHFDCYKVIVADEFHEICPIYETPDSVQAMLRYARHAHLAVIAASQRIADVHKLFTAGCRMTVLFHTEEARDLLAIRDRWGDGCANAVRELRPLLYNDVTRVTQQIPQAIVKTRGYTPRVYDFESNCYLRDVVSTDESDIVEIGGEDETSN